MHILPGVPLFLLVILGSMLLGDAAFWLWGDRRLRRTRHPRVWRPLLGLWVGVLLGYLLWFVLLPEQARQAHAWMPIPILAAMYLWHLLVLPPTLIYIVVSSTAGVFRRQLRGRRDRSPRPDTIEDAADLGFRATPATEASAAASPTFSRRQALAAAVVAVPPLVTGGVVGLSMRQVHRFRINRIELPLATLPAELDGVTIAHVSDLHVGRFTRPPMLPAIADAANALRADFILLTGDLIDLTLSDLPAAMDFVRKLDPRVGMFMVEGNHDLIEDRFAFEQRVRAARLPLLLDEEQVVPMRGGRAVQVMGTTWGNGQSAFVGSLSRLNPWRRPDAFQILLAHHPHAFDTAAAVGIPLTLAGHTHGGQLMLNERLGAGPAMFRYWSGVYRQRDAALVVSNGIGNWFPLRTAAPAEIVHITLRHAPTA